MENILSKNEFPENSEPVQKESTRENNFSPYPQDMAWKKRRISAHPKLIAVLSTTFDFAQNELAEKKEPKQA